MADVNERLAILETEVRHVRSELCEVSAKIDGVSRSLDKQRGFIAGMLCILVPLSGGVVFMAKAAWTKVFG